MDEKKYLYCYKMTDDTGFAPNPYNGVLTLATCKPTIRRCAKVGCWISGWTAVSVQDKNGKRHDFRDKQRLIYLAKVTEVVPLKDYWARFEMKRPANIDDCGDNIYEPSSKESFGFKQHENLGNHGVNEKKHDLSGENVLVCKDFYYFGINHALDIEVGNGFVVPRCKKISLDSEEAKIIIEKVTANNKSGIYENHIKQERL